VITYLSQKARQGEDIRFNEYVATVLSIILLDGHGSPSVLHMIKCIRITATKIPYAMRQKEIEIILIGFNFSYH